jgi:hypothetical protein
VAEEAAMAIQPKRENRRRFAEIASNVDRDAAIWKKYMK